MISCFYSRVGYGVEGPLHSHDFYEFYYALPGASYGNGRSNEPSCIQQLEGKAVTMKPGEIVLFAPGLAHRAGSLVKPSDNCIVLYVDETVFSPTCDADADFIKILHAFSEHVAYGEILLPLAERDARECGKILMDIEGEIARKEDGWRCATKMRTMELLLLIYREWADEKKLSAEFQPTELGRERIRDAVNYIETHYMHPLAVDEMMRILHLSRSHFHNVFRKETGYVFKEYLNRVRVREARKLLEQGELPLSQIALVCGFSSQSRFNHVFREITGRTPSIVRKLGSQGRFS